MLAKRFEAGSFQLPPFRESNSRVDVDTFAAIAGIDFTAARRGWFVARLHEGGSTTPSP